MDNEISLGYFAPIGDGSAFEVFGGIGFAQRRSQVKFTDHKNAANNFNTDVADNRYKRLFIQPAFGKNGKYIDVNIANRFTFITYQKTHTTDLISETVLTVRCGYKNVKFMAQMGFTLFDTESQYGYIPFNIGFGIYLQFNQAIKGISDL